MLYHGVTERCRQRYSRGSTVGVNCVVIRPGQCVEDCFDPHLVLDFEKVGPEERRFGGVGVAESTWYLGCEHHIQRDLSERDERHPRHLLVDVGAAFLVGCGMTPVSRSGLF